MKKTKILALLLSMTILSSTAMPGTLAYGNAGDGVEISAEMEFVEEESAEEESAEEESVEEESVEEDSAEEESAEEESAEEESVEEESAEEESAEEESVEEESAEEESVEEESVEEESAEEESVEEESVEEESVEEESAEAIEITDDAIIICDEIIFEEEQELLFADGAAEEEETSWASASSNGLSYANVYQNGQYTPQKMKDVLVGNDRYSIATFNVDLFDYDPAEINATLNGATNDGNGFHFTGYGVSGCGSNSGINNSGSTYAKQGILRDHLEDGLPVVNHLNGENAGVNTGKILFDDATEADGKTIYNDIPFEVIYDSENGYYEYKSSANHAQLNEAGTKIELYADTLSTENNYAATVDLSTASGISDYEPVETTKNSFTATAKDTNNNSRIDPYVDFAVDNVVASNVDKIYIKAKIPADVGNNTFQLFFTNEDGGSAEIRSFVCEYTANGEWIEFVIDTSSNSPWDGKNYWEGTITSVRVDLFDSNKGPLDRNRNYDVEIAQISFINKTSDDGTNYAYYGGFYPFSEIQDSYPGNDTAFSYNRWEDKFTNASLYRASRSIFNPSPSSESLRYKELAFGTVIEFDFYLPVNKKGLNGSDIIYSFNGDDDLWVFVDGQLVLDIGGGHGPINGNVNFTNGTWDVGNAVTVTGYNTGADSAASAKSGDIADTLGSPGKHTMKIFYLERGGSVSNCYMKFNLPQTPQGGVEVSKEVQEYNNANSSVLLETEFTFTVEIQNNGTGDDYHDKTVWAGADYYIIGSDGSSSNGQTDEYGQFSLKSGESAYFDVAENYYITVTETKADIPDHEWKNTIVNDEEGLFATLLTADGQQSLFEFINIYERLYGDLKISKTGISPLDHNEEETQSTIYVVSGTSDNGETINLEVVIVGNSEITVKDIPCGTYTVTEKTDWSWRYETNGAVKPVAITGGNTAEALFENTREKIYWLSGDSYADNWFGGTDGLERDPVKIKFDD